MQNRADADPKRLPQVNTQFLEALRKRPELTGLNSFFRVTAPQLYVEVDEFKAMSLGVPLDAIYATLQATMGTLYVNDFNRGDDVADAEMKDEFCLRWQTLDEFCEGRELPQIFARADFTIEEEIVIQR